MEIIFWMKLVAQERIGAFRLLISLLTLASCGLLAADSVSAATPRGDKCEFPEDCLRHNGVEISINWGSCECRSAWKKRYIRGTQDKRQRMWAERRMPIADRILDAYRLTESQKEPCNAIREQFWADRRRRLGKQAEETRALGAEAAERFGAYIHAVKQVQEGASGAEDALAKHPRPQDDPVLQDLKQRLDEIHQIHPIDWSDLADRIEDVLPQEQAKRGRKRLGEKFPYTISSTHGEKLGTGEPTAGGDEGDFNRWEAYVRAFTARYQLTQGQSNSVESVLREVRARAVQLAHTMRDDVARYRAGGHQQEARRRREVFQLDLDDLFEVFKARLDGQLTTAQQQQSTP